MKTKEEGYARHVKIISVQMAPLWVFAKLGFYLFLGLLVIGLLAMPFLRL